MAQRLDSGGLFYPWMEEQHAQSKRSVIYYTRKIKQSKYNCIKCGELIDDTLHKKSKPRYCTKCKPQRLDKNHGKYYTRVQPNPRPCEFCGKLFTPKKRRTARHCSKVCNYRALRGIKLRVNCIECGKPIPETGTRKYCSRVCCQINAYRNAIKKLEQRRIV